jgi:hypothetical protein
MSAMLSTGSSQSPADMLRRTRELQAAGPAAGHVTGQHVISKVIIKRYAGPSGPHQGLICPFRLDYPEARHQPLGPDGCGKVRNFIPWGSASAEQLSKETEDRLSDALAAMDAGHSPRRRWARVGDQVRDRPALCPEQGNLGHPLRGLGPDRRPGLLTRPAGEELRAPSGTFSTALASR